MTSIISNFIIFQAAWFITVICAAYGKPFAGPVFTMIWMFYHLTCVSQEPGKELNLLLFAALLGYIMDSTQVLLGFFSFPQHSSFGWPSTVWMIALWINLAATLNFSLRWIKNNLVVAMLMGCIGGPAAYYAGYKLGALAFNGTMSLIAVAIQWSIAMPLLVWFVRRQSLNTPAMISMQTEENG